MGSRVSGVRKDFHHNISTAFGRNQEIVAVEDPR
jgi:hypothetical protein